MVAQQLVRGAADVDAAGDAVALLCMHVCWGGTGGCGKGPEAIVKRVPRQHSRAPLHLRLNTKQVVKQSRVVRLQYACILAGSGNDAAALPLPCRDCLHANTRCGIIMGSPPPLTILEAVLTLSPNRQLQGGRIDGGDKRGEQWRR